jgi:transcriptional regulator with GAF, ATPase, and Fis domain
MTVGTTRVEPPLPVGTEARLAQFTELLATAVSNAESRGALAHLAAEQAALRRVATLVAAGGLPEDVFSAVVKEVGQLLPVGLANLCRYGPDRTQTFVATWGLPGKRFPQGSRWPLGGKNLGTIVFETGRPARIDDYSDASGPVSGVARETDLRSAVGTPIVVDSRLWGIIAVGSSAEEPLPPDTEARLASFTELVATAIANAESRAELARRARESSLLRWEVDRGSGGRTSARSCPRPAVRRGWTAMPIPPPAPSVPASRRRAYARRSRRQSWSRGASMV